jgi:hypothetical protein
MSADETGLGATIRAWRDRLTPAEVGLPSGRARRAAGLRREELADADPPGRLADRPGARFAALWHDGAVGGHAEDRKTIKHPEIGDITVDCDVLNDGDTDLKIVIYTAAPGSEDATKLDLARIAGVSQDSDRTR